MIVLHLEDNLRDADLVAAQLASDWPDAKITLVSHRAAYLEALASGTFDIILSDFRLPDINGRDALALARAQRPGTPFVFLSGTVGEEVAVEIVRAGAADYLLKDRMQRLGHALRRALQDAEARRLHHEAEERIREQGELLNEARDGIVVTDMDNRIIFWNKGAVRILGWSAEEALGKVSVELLGAEIEPQSKESGHQVEWHREIGLVNKLGSRLTVEVRMTLVRDGSGQPKSRLKIITDITEKKKLEEQFLRAQRLESLGMLAAGIAHDLNNVLAPVLMGAPLLRARATHPTDVRLLGSIEESAARGAGLVRQILSFAHGSSGTKTLIQVKHLLRDVTGLLAQTFPKSITLDEHVGPGLWTVLGNPTQVHQVLLNLCVNARDAMPEGGRLRISAANRDIDAAAAEFLPGAIPGPYLELEVSDTGAGIPPEILSRIWDPFFTTKGEGKGTGLGLATVRGIVSNHGGFLTVNSTVGRGTTFRVFLPASSESAGNDQRGGSTHPFFALGKGELVLAVDDEAPVRELLKEFLTRQGYRVLTAENGLGAIAVFAPRMVEIALVITDLSMPEMGGADLARTLPLLNPAVKILFMSGGAIGPDGAPPPGTPILKKPFSGDELLKAVQATLAAAGPR